VNKKSLMIVDEPLRKRICYSMPRLMLICSFGAYSTLPIHFTAARFLWTDEYFVLRAPLLWMFLAFLSIPVAFLLCKKTVMRSEWGWIGKVWVEVGHRVPYFLSIPIAFAGAMVMALVVGVLPLSGILLAGPPEEHAYQVVRLQQRSDDRGRYVPFNNITLREINSNRELRQDYLFQPFGAPWKPRLEKGELLCLSLRPWIWDSVIVHRVERLDYGACGSVPRLTL